jgi:phosphatidylserine decarboxylase
LCYVQAGSTVETGQRIGLMKFGSRMDVFLGPEWEVLVKAGQRVAGGSGILARMRGTA